ncbi:MAG: NAD-dependent epimerase/dehydratase family protein [Vicinamibacterales bacterium]
MRVLVLGGSYFIGRTLVDRLLHDGHTVALLNRGSRSVEGVEQVVADRGQSAQMHAALANRRFDWVIDTSCYTPEQARLALEAIGGRFSSWLYLSTAAVYPGGTTARISEDQVGPGREWEDYGWNKLKAEQVFEAGLSPASQRLTMIRAPYVYGPLNTLPREKWLWARMLQGGPIWIPGAGTTPLHFIHVSDLVDAMLVTLAQASSPVETYNVAQAETPTIRDYVSLLGDVAGVQPRVRPVDYQALGVDVRSFFPFRDYPCLLSTAKLEDAYGWRAHYQMRQGLEQTLAQLSRASLLKLDSASSIEERLLSEIAT